MSELLAIGASHATAPVDLRERLSVADVRTAEFLSRLLEGGAAAEAVVLCTCNRTELYLVAADPVAAEVAALGLLARHAAIRPTELAESIYALRNCDAARHLYRVTSGLESMIVGEAEIQGQVRRAYERARDGGATGPLTNRLFDAALATGKRVRSETAIGERKLSISSIAVALAHDEVGDLRSRSVVVVGAGETSELTARALANEGAGTIFVANRRHERARALAQRYSGEAIGFDDLPARLLAADIVVSATGSPHTILGAEEIAAVMSERRERPLMLIDLAVPRDIDAECAEIAGVTLHDVDDLQETIDRNRSVREAEAQLAGEIVEQEIQEFATWLGSLEVLPTIAALQERGAAIAAGVVADNEGRWESASPRDLERVEALARAIARRLLHEPTLALKRAGPDRSHARIHVLRELFALEQPQASARAQDAADEARPGKRRRQADAVAALEKVSRLPDARPGAAAGAEPADYGP